MIKKCVSIFLAVVMLVLACGCQTQPDSLPDTLRVDDAVAFVAEAAQKTEAADSLTLDVVSFGTNSDGTVYMTRFSSAMVNINSGDVQAEGWRGVQTESESTMTKEALQSASYQAKQYYAMPLMIAQNSELEHYLNRDTEVVAAGEGLYSVSFMMLMSDVNLLCGEDPSDDNGGKFPVAARFYIDGKGYLRELQLDVPLDPADDQSLYTFSFQYSDIGATKLNGNQSESEIVESVFPNGKDSSSLTFAQVNESMGLSDCTVESFQSYAGRMVGGGNFSVTAAIKADGTVLMNERDATDAMISAVSGWTDVVFLENGQSVAGLVAVKKDGSVVIAGFETEHYDTWDLTDFTDIKMVSIGGHTLYGVKQDGTVVATGENASAVAGWKDVTEISADDDNVIALKKDGTVLVTGKFDVTDAAGWTDIVDVSAGRYHVVGLKRNGTVVTAGTNPNEHEYSEHDVADWTDVVGVVAGNMATAGLKKDGSVVVCGYNSSWMDGLGGMVYITLDHQDHYALRWDGRIYQKSDWQLFDIDD